LKKFLMVVAVALSAAAMTVAPAGAVTGNYTEDFDHRYVVLIAFYDSNGDFVWRCSGSLLNAYTVLTAGHCTDTAGGAASAIVWASQDAGAAYDPVTDTPAPSGYPYTCDPKGGPCATSSTLIEYGYGGAVYLQGDNKDVGLVILDSPINVSEYVELPSPNVVDSLRTGTPVTFSGYGVSAEPHVLSFRERLMATGFIINTHNKTTDGFNVLVSNNPGAGRGGTCSGDSGGPLLYDDSDVVLAVTSFGTNTNCAGTGYYYRIDQPDVLQCILQNVEGEL
jgi:hypothetical protein